MPTGCSRYLPPWPLCTVCAREGLTTYWTVPYLRQGQVVVRNKYGGYWNKTRSMVDSGGLSISCMISITNIFQPTDRITTHHTSSCHTGHNRLDEELDKLVSTQDRGFPGFLPVGMKGIRGWLLSQTYQIPTARNHQYALIGMTISHKITNTPYHGGVVTVIKQRTTVLCQGSECLPSSVCKWGCTFWRLPSSSKSYFWKYSN